MGVKDALHKGVGGQCGVPDATAPKSGVTILQLCQGTISGLACDRVCEASVAESSIGKHPRRGLLWPWLCLMQESGCQCPELVGFQDSKEGSWYSADLFGWQPSGASRKK
jgi:hypothetical protein